MLRAVCILVLVIMFVGCVPPAPPAPPPVPTETARWEPGQTLGGHPAGSTN